MIQSIKFVELFAGIGGFSLGFERAGMKCVGHVEINPYAKKVLHKHWPDVPLLSDVTKVKGDEFGKVDVLCGGFPCQDLSVAGKQAGITGERSGLYDEIIRIAGVCRPQFIVLENVANLLSRPEWFGYVLGRLAQIGYDAEWEIIRASDVGAPHKRARIWIVAYPRCELRCKGDTGKLGSGKAKRSRGELHNKSSSKGQADVADTNSKGLEGGQESRSTEKSWKNGDEQFTRFSKHTARENWEVEPDVGRVANGVSSRSHRLKCLGNALVPQIAEYIGKLIMEVENETR